MFIVHFNERPNRLEPIWQQQQHLHCIASPERVYYGRFGFLGAISWMNVLIRNDFEIKTN